MQNVSPWTKSRVRSQVRRLGLRRLAPRLRGRAAVERYRVHPGELSRLSEEPGVVRAGISVASHYDLDVADPGLAEFYVHEGRLAELRRKYVLQPSANPNAWLHVVGCPWPFEPSAKAVPITVAALDLLESEDARSRRAGEALLLRLDPHRCADGCPARG